MEELKSEASEVKARLVGYIGGAFGLVAGLAWNEAITAFIDQIFPLAKDSLWVKFAYAIILTIAVVVIVKQLDKIFNKEESINK